MKIYVASSWRNPSQIDVVNSLREKGHDVYDFRNPAPGDHGFAWSEIDPKWKSWTGEQFIAGLEHPLAVHGFGNDFRAMQWADVCVLVLNCGRSAHLEGGWFVGNGKPLLILIDEPGFEPELMYKMADSVHGTIASICNRLEKLEGDGSKLEMSVSADDRKFVRGVASMKCEIESLKFACANVSAEWDAMRTALADLVSIDPLSDAPSIRNDRAAAHEAARAVIEKFADYGDILACTTAARQCKGKAAEAKANDA